MDTQIPGSDLVSLLGGWEHIPLPNVNKRLGTIEKNDKVLYNQIMDALAYLHGNKAGIDAVSGIHHREMPVSPFDFFTQEKYLGKVGRGTFPLLLDRLCMICSNPQIGEVICTGGIGYGKSYIAKSGICWDLYTLLNVVNPMSLFGNAEGTKIYITTLSVSGRASQSVMWDYVRQTIQGSDWFKGQKPKVTPSEGLVYFPEQNLYFMAGNSTETSIIGENVIGGSLDEANFMMDARQTRRSKMAGDFDQATVLYNALERRRTSRFLLPDNTFLAKFWLVSSKQFPGDFLERQIAVKKDSDKVAIIDYPQWLPRMTSSKHPYGKERFYVFLGNALHQPRILSPEEDPKTVVVPEGCKIQAVPTILRDKYEQDLHGSVRDYSGHSTLARHPFIPDSNIYRGCVCLPELGDKPRQHPFNMEELDGPMLSQILPNRFLTKLVNDEGVTFDQSNREHQKRKLSFHYVPELHPTAPRYIHVDLARRYDGAAFAIGHHGGYKIIRSTEEVDGVFLEYEEERPVTIIDAMIRVYAPRGGEIQAGKMRELIIACKLYGKFHQIKMITYDQYQSNDSLDAFRAMGFNSEVFSVDRDDTAYMTMRQSMYDRRTSLYAYEPLFMDCSSLERDVKTGKIDHTGGRADGMPGTKDVADCVAAIHAHISRDYASTRHGVFTMTESLLPANDEAQAIEAYTKLLRGDTKDGEDPFAKYLERLRS